MKDQGDGNTKEFDTRTLILLSPDTEDAAENSSIPDDDSGDPQKDSDIASKETRKAVDLKDIADAQNKASDEKVTQVYEPRPLTPDDDIYEDIIEQLASAPTKPKYWFEEFGDYWSCSCGHINKGDRCKSCGLERELLRSLFILHKPAGAPGKLNKKLSKATKEKIDQEERQQADRKNPPPGKAANYSTDIKVPIETDGSAAEEHDLPEEQQNEVEVGYDRFERAAKTRIQLKALIPTRSIPRITVKMITSATMILTAKFRKLMKLLHHLYEPHQATPIRRQKQLLSIHKKKSRINPNQMLSYPFMPQRKKHLQSLTIKND